MKKQKNSKFKVLFLLGLICIFIVIFRENTNKKTIAGVEKKEKLNPYQGELMLKVNQDFNLDGLSIEQIARFRIEKVKEYATLNIFPLNYDPLKPPHNKIYGTITSGKNWMADAQFFMANPYLLIVLTYANYATPLGMNLRNTKIKYRNRTIEEIYDADARQWFYKLYYYEDYPGIIRVNMVNAFDAGLTYASIDKERSTNIDFNWKNSPENITASLYSQPGFYHCGRAGKNNLSPADPMGWIKLISKYKETCIYVKLWREKPKNKNQKEDFAYIIKITL